MADGIHPLRRASGGAPGDTPFSRKTPGGERINTVAAPSIARSPSSSHARPPINRTLTLKRTPPKSVDSSQSAATAASATVATRVLANSSTPAAPLHQRRSSERKLPLSISTTASPARHGAGRSSYSSATLPGQRMTPSKLSAQPVLLMPTAASLGLNGKSAARPSTKGSHLTAEPSAKKAPPKQPSPVDLEGDNTASTLDADIASPLSDGAAPVTSKSNVSLIPQLNLSPALLHADPARPPDKSPPLLLPAKDLSRRLSVGSLTDPEEPALAAAAAIQSLTPPQITTVRRQSSINVKPPYQFLIDFIALNHPNVPLQTVLNKPAAWTEAVAQFYNEELKKRRITCLIPIIPTNWLRIDQMLQDYRPLEYVFMNLFLISKYGVTQAIVLKNQTIYEGEVTPFYEEMLRVRRIEHDYPITPDTWLDAEQILQKHQEQTILQVFVQIFLKAGYFEPQLGEPAPQTLDDLYRILLANTRMLECVRSLNFDERQLVDLSYRIFRTKFKNLKELLLRTNLLHQLPDYFLVGSVSLETLLLGNNQFRCAPLDLGETFPNLSVLDLQRNEISEIPRFSAQTFSKLVLLNLERNRIEVIPDDVLDDISQLPLTTMVDLTGNPVCDNPSRLKQYQRKCPQIVVKIALPADSVIPVYITDTE